MPLLLASLLVSSLVLLPSLAVAQPASGAGAGAGVEAGIEEAEEEGGGSELTDNEGTSVFLQFESGVSFLSELIYEGSHPDTLGYGVRGGLRFGKWDLGLQAEHNWWTSGKFDEGATSVLNAGLLAGYSYFDGRVRSSVAAGSSTLLFDTELVDAGKTGLFAEARPVGIRLPLNRSLTFEIHPLNFLVMAPVLDGLPLVEVGYRTTLAIDWTL